MLNKAIRHGGCNGAGSACNGSGSERGFRPEYDTEAQDMAAYGTRASAKASAKASALPTPIHNV